MAGGQEGIDIHLHETGESGLKTVEYLIEKVTENPALKGKTFLSHCFVLGKLEPAKQEEVAEKLGAAQIGILSTMFLNASCSAEAVSRVSPVESLIYRGNLIF